MSVGVIVKYQQEVGENWLKFSGMLCEVFSHGLCLTNEILTFTFKQVNNPLKSECLLQGLTGQSYIRAAIFKSLWSRFHTVGGTKSSFPELCVV